MDIEEIQHQYEEDGYAVVEDALSDEDVDRLNDLIDRDMSENPDDWSEPGSRGTVSNGSLLVTHPELDEFVRYRTTFPLVEAVLPGEPRFAQFDIRDVPPDRTDTSDLGGEPGAEDDEGVHRDAARDATYACLIYYLKDVHDCCPCFAIAPGTQDHESLAAAKADLGDDYHEHEIRGEAGTAILYDITTYHTRRAGDPDCDHGRRTMHNYHSFESNQPLTPWALSPEELAMAEDPETRQFYSQWTPGQVEYAREEYETVPTCYSKEYLVSLVEHFQPPR